MTRGEKIALGIATLWPVLFAFGSQLVALRLLAPSSGVPSPIRSFHLYNVAFVLATGILAWILLIFYIRHVSRNEAIPDDKKRFWQTILFLGNILVMPLYWYKFVWKQR